MADQNTFTDEVLSKIKNNRLAAIILLFGMAIVALSSFTSGISDILKFYEENFKKRNFTIEGNILFNLEDKSIEMRNYLMDNSLNKIKVGLLWGESYIDPRISTINPKTGLTYKLELGDPPPDDVLVKTENVTYNFASIISFADYNDNGLLEKRLKERIISISNAYGIVYIRRNKNKNVTSKNNVINFDLSKVPDGYSLVKIDTPSEVSRFAFTDPDTFFSGKDISMYITETEQVNLKLKNVSPVINMAEPIPPQQTND